MVSEAIIPKKDPPRNIFLSHSMFLPLVVGAHEQSILILCLDQWLITDFGDLLEALITVETKQEISW